jgi:hypothetical protein
VIRPHREYGASRYLNFVPTSARGSIGGSSVVCTLSANQHKNARTKMPRRIEPRMNTEGVCSSRTVAAILLDASKPFLVCYRSSAGKSAGNESAGLRNRNHRNSATVATKAPTESSRESQGEAVREATKA